MKNKVDILSFTYSSKGRDIDIVEPVLSKLELELGVIIKRCWLYDNFVFDILRYKPKMLILANAIGLPQVSQIMSHPDSTLSTPLPPTHVPAWQSL